MGYIYLSKSCLQLQNSSSNTGWLLLKLDLIITHDYRESLAFGDRESYTIKYLFRHNLQRIKIYYVTVNDTQFPITFKSDYWERTRKKINDKV